MERNSKLKHPASIIPGMLFLAHWSIPVVKGCTPFISLNAIKKFGLIYNNS